MAPTDGKPAPRVRVAESGDGKFTNTVTDGRHELLADEPPELGGADAGPTPNSHRAAGRKAPLRYTA